MRIIFEGEGRSEAEKREYCELLKLLPITPAGKESRKLHKRLKAYGGGLEFGRRYPYLSLGLSATALILSIAGVLFRFIS